MLYTWRLRHIFGAHPRISYIFDFCMAAIMLLFGIWFYKSGGKAADYLSGYNMRSADERRKYDEDAMCKAYGKRML